MNTERSREERAFEALILSAVRRLDDEDIDIERLPDPSEKEERALQRLGPDFMDELLAGRRGKLERPETDCEEGELALAGESCGGELHRAVEVDEATAKELEEKDREIIERKLRERERNE